MTSFTKCNVILIQGWPISSIMLGHITLKDHIMIKTSFERSPVEFVPESTGNNQDLGFKD